MARRKPTFTPLKFGLFGTRLVMMWERLLPALFPYVLVVLLIATGVGIILLPFVIVGLLGLSIFGKAVMHAWLGRRITKYFGDGPMKHAAVATLVGSVMVLLLYTVPFLGFFLWKVLDVLGLGVVVAGVVKRVRSVASCDAPALAPAAAAPARPKRCQAQAPPYSSDRPTTAEAPPISAPLVTSLSCLSAMTPPARAPMPTVASANAMRPGVAGPMIPDMCPVPLAASRCPLGRRPRSACSCLFIAT